VRQIIEAGIKELYIDAGKGDDVIDAIPAAQIRDELEANMRAIASAQAPQKIQVSVAEELVAAKQIHKEAHGLVRNLMQDVRLGKLVQVEQVEPVVEQMTASILRNDGALSALCLIKNKDDYTFLHSVSVCALMISFARSLGLDPGQMKQAGIGGLLHDIGKTVTPDRILNKPDRLSDEEFAVMRNHSEDGLALLMKTPGIGDIPRTICIEHHERMDGSGYPKKLNGEQISLMGRLSAIVDVYDAITSRRCYRVGMAPTDVLRKMLEWSKFHFDPQHVQAFMRCIGIYPTGSLVRLASGKLAVVQEQNRDNLLAPRVRAFYDTTKVAHIKPLNIDLMHGTDKILSHESSDKWAMNPLDYLAVLS
jgi:putative nucleotidyltransferase with HDIG domain